MKELKDEIYRLHAENAALQQGYDAARMEIESLRDEVKEYRHGAGVQKALIETLLADKPAGEYPPLPEPYHVAYDDIDKEDVKCFAEGQLRAYVDTDRAMRAQAAPVAQGDALTDSYIQQVPDKCDRIVWRGRYYHLPIDAAEHSYTEPSPMAKVAAALRQKAEQEDAAYQARRSDQGLMESEWGPMEDAPPHEDPPMHVAVVEGDDTVRTLQWNRDVAAFAYPAGTLLYAAHPAAPVAQGDALDAARYRMLRRGQHWSVINGVGDTLRAEELDAAIDAARAQSKEGQSHD